MKQENGGSMPQFGDCSTLLPAPAFCFAFLLTVKVVQYSKY